MQEDLANKLVVAISSRALFDLEQSNAVYEKQGIDEYAQYQIARENEVLKPGAAFPLVKKLLSLNTHGDLVEVILLSRNSTDTGLRIFNSIAHHKLDIKRAAFTSGHSPYQYVRAYAADLFLSTHASDVKRALEAGCAAATMLPCGEHSHHPTEIRIAFDGDSVLFSDEAEKIFQQQGVDAFTEQEKQAAKQPLPGGPFQGFLRALHALQKTFPKEDCPIQTALITARQAPAHERVIRTLRSWNIRIDQALFLGGLEKGEFIAAFSPDIFFDDQQHHCQSANQHVAAGHVPNGIINS